MSFAQKGLSQQHSDRLRPARPHGPARARGLRGVLHGADEGRDRHFGGRFQYRPDVPAAHRGHPPDAGVRLPGRLDALLVGDPPEADVRADAGLWAAAASFFGTGY